MNLIPAFAASTVALALATSGLHAQDKKPDFPVPDDVAWRTENITSEGTGIKKLVTIKGIKHYGAYNEKRHEAQQLALDWFNEHL